MGRTENVPFDALHLLRAGNVECRKENLACVERACVGVKKAFSLKALKAICRRVHRAKTETGGKPVPVKAAQFTGMKGMKGIKGIKEGKTEGIKTDSNN